MGRSVQRRQVARVLAIAGSDSGGGAGLQADLKTLAAHGVYGLTAVTAVTAQNTQGVQAVHPLPPELVRAQIEAVLEDFGANVVKVGMLANAGIALAVADALDARPTLPVVLDPVMVAQSGDRLLDREAVRVLEERLLPRAALLTPNLPEAEELTGRALTDMAAREAACRDLCAPRGAVLLKGGHGCGSEVVDLLFESGRFRRFRHPRLETSATHGTGCTLAAAIAARLALGEPLEAAVGGAIQYLEGAMAHAQPLGTGLGPVHHLFGLRSHGAER